MRIIIDTELNKIIVPDSFFNQIDKMNKVLAENDSDKKVDYIEYIKGSFEKAIKERLAPFDDFPIIFTSAINKQRIFKVVEAAMEVLEKCKFQVYTQELVLYS